MHEYDAWDRKFTDALLAQMRRASGNPSDSKVVPFVSTMGNAQSSATEEGSGLGAGVGTDNSSEVGGGVGAISDEKTTLQPAPSDTDSADLELVPVDAAVINALEVLCKVTNIFQPFHICFGECCVAVLFMHCVCCRTLSSVVQTQRKPSFELLGRQFIIVDPRKKPSLRR